MTRMMCETDLRECIDIHETVPNKEVRLELTNGQIYVYVPAFKTEGYDGLIAVIEQSNRSLQVCLYDAEQEDPIQVLVWRDDGRVVRD
ncbi:MAG TPA: hypothetical protein VEF33_10365 [Syntrophales bacterium]|nr:hypothetical protein [Syntrophales bacterium]